MAALTGERAMRRYYVPQLDGLRFFAFFLVFLHHLDSPARLASKDGWFALTTDFLHHFGWMGVDLFLVLSAFLITTLLHAEQESSGRISFRHFYLRRVLRIWPLYYLAIGIGFFLLPWLGVFAPRLGSPAWQKMSGDFLPAYATLFGNYAVGAHGYPRAWSLSHLWTIALEEQFYLAWPVVLVLLWRCRPITRALVIAALALGTVGLRWYLLGRTVHPAIWTNTLTRLDPLLVGISLALLRKGRVGGRSALITGAQLALGCAVVSSVGLAPNVQSQSIHVVWQYLATAVGFGMIVDAAVTARGGALVGLLSLRGLAWLGRLTYGLYVYHILGIQLAAYLAWTVMPAVLVRSPAYAWCVPAALALVLTIAMAAVSYYGFERYFLRLKSRFAHVSSDRAIPQRGTSTGEEPSRPRSSYARRSRRKDS